MEKNQKRNRQKIFSEQTASLRKKKENFENRYLGIFFILAMAGVIHGIHIYRNTFVHPKFLIVLVMIGSFAFWLIHSKSFKRHKTSVFVQLFCSLAIGGGIFHYLPLLANTYLSHEKIEATEKFSIIETGNLGRGKSGGCQSPYAEINYHGLNKQLVFKCQYEKTIHGFQFVEIHPQKGWLGWDIVAVKELLHE